MIFAVYKDDGPAGPCGQDCYTTSCHNELFIFRTYVEFRELRDKIDSGKMGRKRPRIVDVYSDDPDECLSKVNIYDEGKIKSMDYGWEIKITPSK